MRVVISIHDVCDESSRETNFLIRALERFPKTFLVVPRWKNTAVSRELVALLKNQDLALHGLTHSSAAGDPVGRALLLSKHSLKEFYRLDKKETTRRIMEARALFEDAFGHTPHGFVPPMWYHSRYSIGILRELNFAYTESARRFIQLQEGMVIPSFPVCFDYGNNKALNQLSIFAWRFLRYMPQDLVRLSIHPSDIRNGYWPRIKNLIAWYEDRGAQFTSNKNLSANLCSPSLSVR